MKPDPDSSWRPEPPPQNGLERLINQGARDPGVQGRMFRTLLESEVTTYVPPHPELVGEFERSVDEGFTWVVYQDEKGPFIPVFASEACAVHERRKIKTQRPMMCTLPAKVLLHFLRDQPNPVRLMACGGGTIIMPPEAIRHLLDGDFTAHRIPDNQSGQATMLYAIPPDKVPSKLRQGIRVFCTRHRVPIGVYAFHPQDPATGGPNPHDIRLILWMRAADNDFYNDFSLMAARLVPRHIEMATGVVTSDDETHVAFLQDKPPVWPVMPKGR